MSPAARVLLTVIRIYQMFFSAWMPSACKFYPSCSQYAAGAIQSHGALRGSWLALRRLARCHPFARGGVDLVPDTAEFAGDRICTGRSPVLENIPGASAGNTSSRPESEVHS